MDRIQSFQQMVLKQLNMHMEKKLNFCPHCASYPNINSKQIIDLNVKPKSIKLQKENIIEKPLWSWVGKDFYFLGKSPREKRR